MPKETTQPQVTKNAALLAEMTGFIRGHLQASPQEDIVIPKEVALSFLKDYWDNYKTSQE